MSKSEDSYDKLFEDLLRESARAAADFDADEVDEVESQQDLSDRHALRRVKSFSTELQDISEAEYRQLQLERVVLVGVWTEGTAEMADNSLEELKALAETAGSEVLEG
jgi:GTP-binding protein HflX